VDWSLQSYASQHGVSVDCKTCGDRTTLNFTRFLVAGYVVLVLTSLPTALDHGAGLGGLVTTMVFIGIGGGGISAVMYPLIGM
jgi:dipeptide/tripeptide permease